MKNLASRLQQQTLLALAIAASSMLVAGAIPASASAWAQAAPVARITAEVAGSKQTLLPNSKHPLAQAQFDTGRLAANTRLQGMTISFSRSAAQQADLEALMAAQQNPSSPQYQQGLTPEQFGARFGMAASDIAKTRSWLEQQGFTIDSVSRAQNEIHFSGTVKQVEQAFSTEMHTYSIPIGGKVENHFAPSTALSVPSALAPVVLGVINLSNFTPRPHLVSRKTHPNPHFSGFDDTLFFAPGDVATEYDIAGGTGAGQTIAVVGQSEIELSDIEAFQTAAGLTVKDPVLVPVPNTGSIGFSSGDETESDIDLEWSGAIAPGATIQLVYASISSGGAFNALDYAIQNHIGTIISSSYGDCETDIDSGTLQTLEQDFQQAVMQKQTVISAAGDDGVTDCYQDTNLTLAQQQAPAVDYPASSAYVTGLGGTEISQANSAYLTQGSAYWSASNGQTDVITSVLQYIPEQAWNENSFDTGCGETDCLVAGGGGASALFSKPTWQSGVTGIPSDGKRDVPDISLNSALGDPGYLYCSSDAKASWQEGQQGSCTSGFRDSFSEDLTVAGGTSFAAPIFAGMVAILNQKLDYTSGQGLINPMLYSLASNSSTYGTAFHDIQTGNNSCPTGAGFCKSAVTGFSAGPGYDQVTGLGTINFYNLANVWSTNVGSGLTGTTTTVSASNTAPTVNASDTFTVTVTSSTGTTIPTGTVTITVDSDTPITGNTLTSNGTFTYTTSFTTAGPHTVLASYSGDATHAASTGNATVNAAAVNSGVGSFTISAANLTIPQGGSGSSTITVTPANGYTGTVVLSVSASSSNLANVCAVLGGNGNVVISGKSSVSTTLTIDANAVNCVTTGQVRHGKQLYASSTRASLGGAGTPVTAAAVFAGLLLAGFLGRYSRKLRVLAGIILLATVGMAFSGCGGNNSDNISNAPKGTYTINVTGQDASSSSIPEVETTFTLTID